MSKHPETVPTIGVVKALTADDHSQGEAKATLTLLEYGDYECPACIQAEPLTQHFVDAFGNRLRFIFRHCPMVDAHPHAWLAAEAAEAAAAQGQFWPMHRLLFKQTHHLELPALTAYAQFVGLDMIRFNAEMADRIYTQRVQEHRHAAQASAVRSTPAFFVNGRPVDVAAGLERLELAVHSALKS
jgi:protein-disulfide isomerase